MDWGQFLILFLSMIAMGLSARSDWRKTDEKIEEHQRETNQIIRAIQEDMKAFHNAMERETKDFHGRLCSIEENRKK